MANFTYRAYNSDGIRVCGCKNAQTKDTVKAFLDKNLLTDYEIHKSDTLYTAVRYKLVSPRELSLFCKQMSVIFFSNITLMEGIALIKEQTENKQLKIALREINGHMEQGYTLAGAMGMYENVFGSYLLNMVTVGEATGTLDSVFASLSVYMDKEGKMRKKIRSAVTYPAILTVLMSAIVVLLIVKVLPMFEAMLQDIGAEMNSFTAGILSVSSFLASYGLIVLGVIAAAIAGFVIYSGTDKGRLWKDKFLLLFPLTKFTTARMITARFSRSLALLVKSGVQLINSLEEAKTVIGNTYLEPKFSAMIDDVKKGAELSEAFGKTGVFPPLFLKMVFLGQKTGHLDEMLDKAASVFDDEVDEALEKIAAMLEPVLIIILSVVVGIILISVMLPMVEIMNNIG